MIERKPQQTLPSAESSSISQGSGPQIGEVTTRMQYGGIPLLDLKSVKNVLSLLVAWKARQPEFMYDQGITDPRINLEKYVTKDAATGLYKVRKNGRITNISQKAFLSDTLCSSMERVLNPEEGRTIWEWSKPQPVDVRLDTHLLVRSIPDNPTAYVLNIGYGDNAEEKAFAQKLGITRGFLGCNVDVVLFSKGIGGPDLGEIAPRLQEIYADLSPITPKNKRLSSHQPEDVQRPTLTAESLVHGLVVSGDIPKIVRLGVQDGVEVALKLGRNVHRVGYQVTGERYATMSIDGRNARNPLGESMGINSDDTSPTVVFSIGVHHPRFPINLRTPVVDQNMQAKIVDLSGRVEQALLAA